MYIYTCTHTFIHNIHSYMYILTRHQSVISRHKPIMYVLLYIKISPDLHITWRMLVANHIIPISQHLLITLHIHIAHNITWIPTSQDLHITHLKSAYVYPFLKICKSHYIYTSHVTLHMHITCIPISQEVHIPSLKSAHVYPSLKICTWHDIHTSYMTLHVHVTLYTDISRSAHVSTRFSRCAHYISQDPRIKLHVRIAHDITRARERVAKTQPMAYKVA